MAMDPKARSMAVADWTVTQLQNLFVDTVRTGKCPPLIILIDTLDEGQEEEVRQAITLFEALGWRAPPGAPPLQSCLSSRPYPHISVEMGLSMTVEDESGHMAAILAYVEATLQGDSNPQFQALGHAVVRKSASVFLWVKVLVQMLNKALDKGKGGARQCNASAQECPSGLAKALR